MNEEILSFVEEEFNLMVEELKLLYEASGKKVSGQWGEALEVVRVGFQVQLKGYDYLSGRGPGQMPPIQAIEEWIRAKGIQPLEANITVSSLAWAIAKSIAKRGTNKDYHQYLYDEVITPLRIQQILNTVAEKTTKIYVDELLLTFDKAWKTTIQ